MLVNNIIYHSLQLIKIFTYLPTENINDLKAEMKVLDREGMAYEGDI